MTARTPLAIVEVPSAFPVPYSDTALVIRALMIAARLADESASTLEVNGNRDAAGPFYDLRDAYTRIANRLVRP